MQVIVKRFPTNPQVVDLEPTNLVTQFEGIDEDGYPRPYTFFGPDGQPGPFIIPAGTKGLPMDTSIDRDAKNLTALRALLKKYPTPSGMIIKIIDLAQNAEAENLRRQKRRAVEARITERESDTGFMVSLARRLGHATVEKVSQQETIDYVYARCEADPDTVAAILDDAHQQQLFVITDSLAKGFLTRDVTDGIYKYGTRLIGRTEESVLQLFADSPDIYMELGRQLGRTGIAAAMPSTTTPPSLDNTSTSTVVSTAPAVDESLIRRDETRKLVEAALASGILTETIDERNNPCLAFGAVKFSNMNRGGTPVEQAIESLLLNNNKSIRIKLEARLK